MDLHRAHWRGAGRGGLRRFAGEDRGGIFLTLLVGAVGALALAWIARQVGLAMPGQTFGFFIAVIGTALILAIWRTAMGRAYS